jgi:release factor glutamine methyltransferase
MLQAVQHIKNELQNLYSQAEIRSFACLILEKLTGWSQSEILLCKDANLSIIQRRKFDTFVEKLKTGMPVQYLLGTAAFMGLDFFVNPSTLIPRPETEELVEWIVEEHVKSHKISILDIGTGSGCIAVALKKFIPQAGVWALDISEEALATAKKNAADNAVDVQFFARDIFKTFACSTKFDVIVSNPPYIALSEKVGMARNVLDYEPLEALFVPDDDALVYYRRIAVFAQENLSEGGSLYFEINRQKGRETMALLHQKGFTHIELRKDLSGNDRMVKARKN